MTPCLQGRDPRAIIGVRSCQWTRISDYAAPSEQDRPGLVGLYDPRSGPPRRRRKALRAGRRKTLAARFSRRPCTIRSRSSTSPRPWNTSTPGGTPPTTIRRAFAGPIGPTEQLPLVARLVNDLDLDVRQGHFWGMDEWVDEAGLPVPVTHPLSFARADRELCFQRIRRELRMPDAHLHFPSGDLNAYSASYDEIRCVVMQGGQGEVKHWAFNDPPRRKGRYKDAPPTPRRIPPAQDPRDRLAPDDDHPECADLRRRASFAGADAGGHGGAGRNLESREEFRSGRPATTTTRSACGSPH